MARKFQIGLVALSVCFASCQREIQPLQTDSVTGNKLISVTAQQDAEQTRTSISQDDAAAQYVFCWETGDRISLLEAVLSPDGPDVQIYESEPVAEPCEVAVFPTELGQREMGENLFYMACYPSEALRREDPFWNDQAGNFSVHMTMPEMQYPRVDSFDPAADLLVSQTIGLNERPDNLDLCFLRLGSILKLKLTGMEPGTLVRGGSIFLGYACQGTVEYDASSEASVYPGGEDGISFSYSTVDSESGEQNGLPLVSDDNGSVTVWLRLRPGVADRVIRVLVDAEKATGEEIQYSRDINLVVRGKSVSFKDGGLTTLSVQVNGEIPGDGVVPRDMRTIPALYIDTPNSVPINSKVNWVDNTRIRIVGDEGRILFDDSSAKIRGRGNSTWNWPKKPYYFKLNKKTDLLGAGKSKKYILLANWMDRTLLRNAVALEAARRTSLAWTPSGIFVEVYINGVHKGNYLLVEKIEVESGRLTADYLFTTDTSDPTEVDYYTPFGYRVYQNLSGMPVEVKYPDRDDYDDFGPVINETKALFNSLGSSISAGNSSSVLDWDSVCDWYLVHELCCNWEPNHPKSCYLYVYDGKFYFGPVWDFDWGTFRLDWSGLILSESMYFRDLFLDPQFVSRLRERWQVLKPRFETLDRYIDAQADWIRESEATNHTLWPISSRVNQDETISFQEAVDRMKLFLDLRIAELDELFNPSLSFVGAGTNGQETMMFYIQ